MFTFLSLSCKSILFYSHLILPSSFRNLFSFILFLISPFPLAQVYDYPKYNVFLLNIFSINYSYFNPVPCLCIIVQILKTYMWQTLHSSTPFLIFTSCAILNTSPVFFIYKVGIRAHYRIVRMKYSICNT